MSYVYQDTHEVYREWRIVQTERRKRSTDRDPVPEWELFRVTIYPPFGWRGRYLAHHQSMDSAKQEIDRCSDYTT